MISLKNENIADSVFLQLGLHYFSEFKTTSKELLREDNIQNCLFKGCIFLILFDKSLFSLDQRQRKAFLSLRRAILCFHNRYPMLAEHCYREGKTFI